MPSLTKKEIELSDNICDTVIHLLELEVGEKTGLKLKDCNMVFKRVE